MKEINKKIDNRMKIGIGITIAFVLFFVVSFSVRAEMSLLDKVAQIAGEVWGRGLAEKTEVGDLNQSFGAMPGSELYTDYFCVNSVCSHYKTGDFINSSTTLFAFKNPWNATSSISEIYLSITGGASTTRQFLIGTSTTAYLPVTSVPFSCTAADPIVCADAPIKGFSLGTSTKGTLITNGDSFYYDGGFGQDITNTMSSDDFIIGPSEYIVGYSTTTSRCGFGTAACRSGQDGVVNSDNVFTGTYKIKVDRIK